MNSVVHSAYGIYFLDSVDCSAEKKDGRYIFDLVDRCIEELGVQNVVQVVTDNARANLRIKIAFSFHLYIAKWWLNHGSSAPNLRIRYGKVEPLFICS